MKSADSSEQQLPSAEVPSKCLFLNENGECAIILVLICMGGLQRPRAGLRDALCGFQHALPLSEPHADLSPSLRPPLQLGGCVQRTF